jgi:hypothetical protein
MPQNTLTEHIPGFEYRVTTEFDIDQTDQGWHLDQSFDYAHKCFSRVQAE